MPTVKSTLPDSGSDTPHKQALRLPQVLSKTGLSRSNLYRLVARGQFPKGFKLSERTVVWDEAQVDGWLQMKFGGFS